MDELDLQALWTFLRDKDNRETLSWIGAALAALAGMIAARRKLRKGRAEAGPCGPDQSRHAGISVSQGHGSRVRTGNVHVDNRRGMPFRRVVFLQVIVAACLLFAVFATLRALGGGAEAALRCEVGKTLPSDAHAAARALNSRGIYHAERGERRAADRCFEAALSHDPGSWDALSNLWRLHGERPGGDPERALGAAELWVGMQSSRMAQWRPDRSPALRGLSCSERVKFTGEGFDVLPWIVLSREFVRNGRPDDAVSVARDGMSKYPRQSCTFEAATTQLRVLRGGLRCLAGDPAGARADFDAGFAARPPDAGYVRRLQAVMRDSGGYAIVVDGAFGPASDTALSRWLSEGCPGLAEIYAAP